MDFAAALQSHAVLQPRSNDDSALEDGRPPKRAVPPATTGRSKQTFTNAFSSFAAPRPPIDAAAAGSTGKKSGATDSHAATAQAAAKATAAPIYSRYDTSNMVLVNRVQDGNPVLKQIRQVSWRFADIEPDFVLGNQTAALYLRCIACL
jgi:hypothetical protein